MLCTSACLKPVILLPHPPECWNYRCVTPHLVFFSTFFFFYSLKQEIYQIFSWLFGQSHTKLEDLNLLMIPEAFTVSTNKCDIPSTLLPCKPYILSHCTHPCPTLDAHTPHAHPTHTVILPHSTHSSLMLLQHSHSYRLTDTRAYPPFSPIPHAHVHLCAHMSSTHFPHTPAYPHIHSLPTHSPGLIH